jgi:hypothetical protein
LVLEADFFYHRLCRIARPVFLDHFYVPGTISRKVMTGNPGITNGPNFYLVHLLPFAARARSRGRRGTKAAGSVTLPPLVLARLPLGWDQRTKIPTEEHHPMTCCDFRAAAANMQLVAMLGSSSCISL